MTKTGLFIALAIAIVVSFTFTIYPNLDLKISALFFGDHSSPEFKANALVWTLRIRKAEPLIIALLSGPAILALIGKLLLPQRRMLIGGRAALFLAVTLALGPGVVTNTLFKDHWGRFRPVDVTAFGGEGQFRPWWDPRGECSGNCSFIAGEAAGAFWTFAPAALVPPQWSLPAYSAALAFGLAMGLLRIAAGAHFFTDVVFAGVLMYLIIWIAYGLLFRWRTTGITDDMIDRSLTRAGEAIHRALGAFVQRIVPPSWKDG